MIENVQFGILQEDTRGKEVIKLLESFGGINSKDLAGSSTQEDMYYYINPVSKIIEGIRIANSRGSIRKLFTLDEFKSQFPFEIGDKVRFKNDIYKKGEITSKYWDFKTWKVKYEVTVGEGAFICYGMYDSGELELVPIYERKDKILEPIPEKADSSISINLSENNEDKVVINLGNSYEISENEGNQIVLSKKALKFPKTYEECLKVLGYDENSFNARLNGLPSEFAGIERLVRIIVCRNAYWKLVNYKEPVWEMYTDKKYCIIFSNGEIKFKDYVTESKILAFPNAELRQIFYDNFKVMIDECKKLI